MTKETVLKNAIVGRNENGDYITATLTVVDFKTSIGTDGYAKITAIAIDEENNEYTAVLATNRNIADARWFKVQ